MYAAVIVTYNRKELLVRNLESIIQQTSQVDTVIIIDNASNDGTEKEILDGGYFSRLPIDYVRMNTNTGGAGGFSYGVKHAFDKGADWILLMDDDGYAFDSNTFERLFSFGEHIHASANTKVAINSLVTTDGESLSFTLPFSDEEIKKSKENGTMLKGAINPFNCTLISREVIDEIGFPRADFFMSCDEREYNKRIEECGAYIGTVSNSIYVHPQARDPIIVKNGVVYETFLNRNKEYYYLRNNICIKKDLRRTYRLFIKQIKTVLWFEDKKLNRIINCLKATWDAWSGNMGKRL